MLEGQRPRQHNPTGPSSSAVPGAREGAAGPTRAPACYRAKSWIPTVIECVCPGSRATRSVWELKASGGHVVGRVLRSLKILGNGTKVLLIREHFGAHTRTADSLHTGVRDTQECETPHLSRDVRGRRSCGGSGLR